MSIIVYDKRQYCLLSYTIIENVFVYETNFRLPSWSEFFAFKRCETLTRNMNVHSSHRPIAEHPQDTADLVLADAYTEIAVLMLCEYSS